LAMGAGRTAAGAGAMTASVDPALAIMIARAKVGDAWLIVDGAGQRHRGHGEARRAAMIARCRRIG
jgi:hypothetical protein